MSPPWLPGLVYLSDYGGNARIYIEALYLIFKEDFIVNNPTYRGQRVRLIRQDLVDGKHATFWHIIQDRPSATTEFPDLRRCERIRWPKPIIENNGDPLIKIWEEKSRKDKCILIYLEDEGYVVILSIRRDYLLLKSAYPVKYELKKKELLKNYSEYKRKLAPPS